MVASVTAFVVLCIGAAQTGALPAAWEFDSEADVSIWKANGQLADVACAGGVLTARATDWDPFFICQDVSLKTGPYQYVVIRVKADKPGTFQLFWTGNAEGMYAGFSEEKSVHANVKGDGSWEEVLFFPFWQTEGTIRKLRLDVYDAAKYEIDWIRVEEWGVGVEPNTSRYSWDLGGDIEPWRLWPGCGTFWAPPLRLSVDDKGWVSVLLASEKAGVGAIIWATAKSPGLKRQSLAIQASDEPRWYNLELQGGPEWQGDIVALGLELADDGQGARVESIQLSDRPSGPADVEVVSFGFENAINRAKRECRVMAQLANNGGATSSELTISLGLPAGVSLTDGAKDVNVPPLKFGERAVFFWTVRGENAGPCKVSLESQGPDAPARLDRALKFDSELEVRQADYVPEPQPVATDIDVLAYYFPGWESAAKWDCIRNVAPIRKPLLGYYDEANPECVDWQIKWAVENGITCFLVDWYWCQGNQHLRHWFEAYKKSRYRKYLKVAIMWANHNPAGTHSAEDWRKVTREWIDNYFGMDTYYRIDGKPAVFIWSPPGVRADLDGTDGATAVYAESQEIAKAAGYEGITYIAMGYGNSAALCETLAKEGYSGFTTYHEWGKAVEMSTVPNLAQYADVAATSVAAWDEKEKMAGRLTYYPVGDTGWDSRPWHGSRGLVIEGRTPALFEEILIDLKAFATQHGKKAVVLAPVNEWGEGSYIEPCAEYGFEMYEAVRRVFAKGDPADWPVNLAPADVGRGPYDFPEGESSTKWTFDTGLGGWTSLMNVTEPVCKDGAMRFKTTTNDPAITAGTSGLTAEQYPQMTVRMRIIGDLPEGQSAQMFWASDGKPIEEASSVSFPLAVDGESHVYSMAMDKNPRWRGKITSLRFDPGTTANVEVVVEEILFDK